MPKFQINIQERILFYVFLITTVCLSTTFLLVLCEHGTLFYLIATFVLPQLVFGHLFVKPKDRLTIITSIIIPIITFCLFLLCVYCSILIENCDLLVYATYILAYIQIAIVWEMGFWVLLYWSPKFRQQLNQ